MAGHRKGTHLSGEILVVLAAIAVVVLVIWALLKMIARVITTAVVIGLLVVGLVVAAGRLTDQPPERLIDSAVATVTTEATRAARANQGVVDASQPARATVRP